MLETLLQILHVMACLFLILVVLLQTGRGAGIGASFGGATQTFFGGRGATSFLEKLTAVSALVFVLTSMTLAYQSTRSERGLSHQTARAQRRERARQLPTKAAAPTKAGEMSVPEGTPAAPPEEPGAAPAPAPTPTPAPAPNAPAAPTKVPGPPGAAARPAATAPTKAVRPSAPAPAKAPAMPAARPNPPAPAPAPAHRAPATPPPAPAAAP